MFVRKYDFVVDLVNILSRNDELLIFNVIMAASLFLGKSKYTENHSVYHPHRTPTVESGANPRWLTMRPHEIFS